MVVFTIGLLGYVPIQRKVTIKYFRIESNNLLYITRRHSYCHKVTSHIPCKIVMSSNVKNLLRYLPYRKSSDELRLFF